ncbi:bifunctional histidinol-phosphatase/imidazoleglycerol-phosphate dehydratase HisB [Hugenholtzia roseola]|uniref:bifunctional histidinol-phosphatase/imidazoleglycerol-phosphate dehydratase HisB n=1 Tax=Hugenholtzia roseola TaxID=1002 RepID=UPI0004077F27|nr:bifunctional histidinol-phosphatase/imidazoleglycerol-phosphate dehydratase HisB [Hugenholtzia roseola]
MQDYTLPKLLFIDRDGTLIKEPADEQIDSLEKLELLPKMIQSLLHLQKDASYRFLMVTNQDGLGTASFPEPTFWQPHQKLMGILEGEGIFFEEVLIDKTFPHQNAPTRKPRTGLVEAYLDAEKYDLANSFTIGDRFTDIEFAKNIGCKGIFISPDPTRDRLRLAQERPDLVPFCACMVENWAEIVAFLESQKGREATLERKTSETQIRLTLDLDGEGKASIQTGVGFFDHMLEQIAKHGRFNLHLQAQGDLHIEAHHLIEDVGIALGMAFKKALGDKKGINRYGFFILPMDEVRAEAILDLSGRAAFVWSVPLKREMIGNFPMEMVAHFFKSFSDQAACNLHLQAQGENDHHLVEGIFKAFAKALKIAVSKSGYADLPSTKGVL